MSRPSPQWLQAALKQLTSCRTDRESLRRQALLNGDGLSPLRSIYWAIALNVLQPDSTTWEQSRQRNRERYNNLSEEFLRDPSGRWLNEAAHVVGKDEPASSKFYDPLGHEKNNPWPAWYRDLDLIKVIRQDVLRTFPEDDYFRSINVQNTMTNILFVFAKLHSRVSYRQGMHEILALLLRTVDYDSIELQHDDKAGDLLSQNTAYVIDRAFVAHDAFALYSALMTRMLELYDPSLSVHVPQHQPVQSIVARCADIYDLLKEHDPELWHLLDDLQIEPQMWGLKWLRLLFSREFDMSDVLVIWDCLFTAEDEPTLRLADCLAVSMLISIRSLLLNHDYSSVLQSLLRFPATHAISVTVRAMLLQADRLMRTLAGPAEHVSADVTIEPPPNIQGYPPSLLPSKPIASAPRSVPTATTSIPASPASLLNTSISLAEGIYARSEALGINQAVFNRLNDLSRVVQGYQQQHLPIVLSGSGPPSESQEGESRHPDGTAMAAALRLALSTIQKHLEGPDVKAAKVLQTSLQAIEHVASVLDGETPHFDATRLASLIKGTDISIKRQLSAVQTASVNDAGLNSVYSTADGLSVPSKSSTGPPEKSRATQHRTTMSAFELPMRPTPIPVRSDAPHKTYDPLNAASPSSGPSLLPLGESRLIQPSTSHPLR